MISMVWRSLRTFAATIWRIIAGFSALWGCWGLGLWIKALFVRWMGRKVLTDYEDGELFNR
jgi:hypothetical protein